MNGLEKKIFPINEWEWHTLERDLAHWIRTSGYRLDQSEQRPFRRVGFYTLMSGVTSGYLIHFLLGNLPRVPKKTTRIVISIFSGLYSSAVSTRMLRKSVFSQVLEMNSPLGDTARQILLNARNNQIMQQNFRQSTEFVSPATEYESLNSGDILNDPYDTNSNMQLTSMNNKLDVHKESDDNSNVNGLGNIGREKFRSWEDIRKKN